VADLIDPAARHLYRLVVPGAEVPSPSMAATGPRPAELVAYDLEPGREAGRLTLPDVRAGHWQTGRVLQSDGVMAGLSPALAFSPDGRRLFRWGDIETVDEHMQFHLARPGAASGGPQ
jgi:hypothetical protein